MADFSTTKRSGYPTAADHPPDFFQKYILTDSVLGSGSGIFADVLVGIRKKDKKKVAVKVIDPNFSRTEAIILKKLSHKNIVQFYDYFPDSILFYDVLQCLLVMECMEGGELLHRIISRAAYDENQARDAARNVLLAIEYCHKNSILHRDLKPDNLLLKYPDDDADLKLADFGVAIELPPEGWIQTSLVGTPRYFSPEVLLGNPYGRPADMWSFGIVLYILLCGQYPFDSDNQVASNQLEFQVGQLENISPEAASLIRSILLYEPSQRLTATEALAHPWFSQSSDHLQCQNLSDKLPALKIFLARRKFKGGVHAVIATKKFSSFASKASQRGLQEEGATSPKSQSQSQSSASLTQNLVQSPKAAEREDYFGRSGGWWAPSSPISFSAMTGRGSGEASATRKVPLSSLVRETPPPPVQEMASQKKAAAEEEEEVASETLFSSLNAAQPFLAVESLSQKLSSSRRPDSSAREVAPVSAEEADMSGFLYVNSGAEVAGPVEDLEGSKTVAGKQESREEEEDVRKQLAQALTIQPNEK